MSIVPDHRMFFATVIAKFYVTENPFFNAENASQFFKIVPLRVEKVQINSCMILCTNLCKLL